MKENIKEWLKIIGLGGLLTAGSIFSLALIVVFFIAFSAGPVVLIIWVIWKLFFS